MKAGLFYDSELLGTIGKKSPECWVRGRQYCGNGSGEIFVGRI
jgi:hypothetical protein